MNRILLFLVSFFLSGSLFAQLSNNVFVLADEADSSKKSSLWFDFYNFSFVKNNEYFNKIAEGYTLFGNQLMPVLKYYPTEKVSLELGLFAQKDFGNNKYTVIQPIFAVKIKHNNLKLIFGSLEGAMNHQLVEPLYDFERIMNNRLENGLQGILKKDKIFVDAWFNWEKMIYRGDSVQEYVSGGLSALYKCFSSEKFQIELPLQFVAMHQGGQIDVSEAPLTTRFNSATGIKFTWKFAPERKLKALCFDNYFLFSKDFSNVYQHEYIEGSGYYLNFSTIFKEIVFMLSYWNGDKYTSTHGGNLYNSESRSVHNPKYLEANRKLLIFRYIHEIEVIKGLHLSSRIEPHYDFEMSGFEFYTGLYIVYKPSFKLIKFTK